MCVLTLNRIIPKNQLCRFTILFQMSGHIVPDSPCGENFRMSCLLMPREVLDKCNVLHRDCPRLETKFSEHTRHLANYLQTALSQMIFHLPILLHIHSENIYLPESPETYKLVNFSTKVSSSLNYLFIGVEFFYSWYFSTLSSDISVRL